MLIIAVSCVLCIVLLKAKRKKKTSTTTATTMCGGCCCLYRIYGGIVCHVMNVYHLLLLFIQKERSNACTLHRAMQRAHIFLPVCGGALYTHTHTTCVSSPSASTHRKCCGGIDVSWSEYFIDCEMLCALCSVDDNVCRSHRVFSEILVYVMLI